ncbi:hypothetical protein [Streptomyces sp. NPDC006368]|uniref:hypothetical protein n=1 Tax=Streptomyces sp. NPDC006368 TaxID=3156760 RepID=UPI00339F8C7E
MGRWLAHLGIHHRRFLDPEGSGRLDPDRSPHAGLAFYQVLDALKDLPLCWTGTCTP